MMRKFTSLFTGAALTLGLGLLGCVTAEDVDPFDSLTTTSVGGDETTGGDGDGDATTTGDPTTTSGDGDGDPTTTGGDGDGDASCGAFNEACCAGDVCDAGLTCDAGVCGLGGGTTDDPTTTGGGDGSWDPTMCEAPAQPIGVMGLDGNFCSAPCSTDAECPAGPAGTMPACALIADGGMNPTNCGLLCDPTNDACPAGSTCKDLEPLGNPGVGLCTYP